jgi:hypothetical protein
MTNQLFRSYWPRETGIESGDALGANDLPPEVRDQVLTLAGNDPGEFALRLPFMDAKECRRQSEILRGLSLMREGYEIRAVLGPQAAARDLAAISALIDPVWRNAPTERQPAYFTVWQRVSLALQKWLRNRIAEAYFEDVARFEDRQAAYPVIVYQSSRLCHGHPRTEFTYDLRDYPECHTTLTSSWKMTGRATQAVLRVIECRLLEAGLTALAHRYTPVWHQDVLVSVQKKPKPYVELLMAEAALINAAIDLGTERSVQAANRFATAVNLNLRKVAGMDLRGLGVGLLLEATRVLGDCRGDHLVNGGMFKNGDMRTARSPDPGIGSQENGDDANAHGGCQVRDTGIVADVNSRGGEPAGQLI